LAKAKSRTAAGDTLAARLARLGIHSQAALLTHLPLRYEDETRITAIRDVRDGVPVQLEAEVVDCAVQPRPRRQLLVRVRDASGEATLRFLNFYPNMVKLMPVGARLRIFGEARAGFGEVDLIHPRVKAVDAGAALPNAMTPVYPATAGLAQSALRKLIDRTLKHESLDDTLPESVRQRYRLAPFADSLRALHHPSPETPLAALEDRSHPAWQRVKFDELLAQQISLRKAYAARRAQDALALSPGGALTAALLAQLPFRLTGAQQRAWHEIERDLAGSHPMQRLLQGDVGSGKTIVAALAMLRAAEHGAQAALMAPTEILAEQHYRKLSGWLSPLGLDVAWLSGSLKKSLKRVMTERLQSGELLLAVGTHALIEDAVDFPNLALAVVDEQHRFGVRQRLALREKGREHEGGTGRSGWGGVRRASPHQLMMSATPIPRTLAMSFYADLDVSVVDELPPGRTPVLTKLVAEARRGEVIGRVREACSGGRQAYWVCPLIEESETLQLKTALETYQRLQGELAGLAIGLVHGRLKPAEKAQVMEAFVAGRLDLLVATTVIEVGVDVPNASLMVIEHAERFGLSQLHQLRGRVGRGAAQSACILLYASPLGETARARLKIIYENGDGFEIARQDLALRGPGEFVGARQSGVPLLRFADLALDAPIVEQAREAAEIMLREHPDLAQAHLARWLGARQDYLKV
jgi:ATP-dependent DNA helicase RecG